MYKLSFVCFKAVVTKQQCPPITTTMWWRLRIVFFLLRFKVIWIIYFYGNIFQYNGDSCLKIHCQLFFSPKTDKNDLSFTGITPPYPLSETRRSGLFFKHYVRGSDYLKNRYSFIRCNDSKQYPVLLSICSSCITILEICFILQNWVKKCCRKIR